MGLLGKEIMQRFGFSSYCRRGPRQSAGALVIVFLFGGCAGGPPVRFVGTISPLSGSCDPPGRAVLTRTPGHVQFVPFDGVIILQGSISQAGTIDASLAVRGTGTAPRRLQFNGQLQRTRISGTYITPRCRYLVELAAPAG